MPKTITKSDIEQMVKKAVMSCLGESHILDETYEDVVDKHGYDAAYAIEKKLDAEYQRIYKYLKKAVNNYGKEEK